MVGSVIDNSVNSNLLNLTPIGKNISNWSSNVTNCITEIPQNIELTLSSGTLTLKSGSKYYMPDGTQYKTSSDLTTTQSSDGKFMIFTPTSGASIATVALSNCVSGSTDSIAGTPYHSWYDTTNNVINYYSSDGTTPLVRALPLAIVTVSDGAISSIDQVFNGFGFIGSTIFALPNIKWIGPYGRNSDGTLKNIYRSLSSVRIYTFTSVVNGIRYWILRDGATQELIQDYAEGLYNQGKSRQYCSIKNTLESGSGVVFIDGRAYCGYVTVSSGKVTGLYTKTVLHAADSNNNLTTFDKTMITSWVAPKWDAITNLSSGETLDKNGWIIWKASANNTGSYIEIDGVEIARTDGSSGHWVDSAQVQVLGTVGQTVSFTDGTCYFVPCIGG